MESDKLVKSSNNKNDKQLTDGSDDADLIEPWIVGLRVVGEVHAIKRSNKGAESKAHWDDRKYDIINYDKLTRWQVDKLTWNT